MPAIPKSERREEPRFMPLRNRDEDSEEGMGSPEEEEEGFLAQKDRRLKEKRKQRLWTISARACTLLNICLTIFLLGLWGSTWRRSRGSGIEGPEPPYSPLWEDGVVRYVNKRIHPQKIFQSEPSDEVDRAWNATLGSSDGLVQIPKERTAKLPETVESWADDGWYIYGVSVFHQLHCLNRLRQSFYPERYFPNETEEEITFHKNHCFDLLRQVIMCNGDVSLTTWWNNTYSYIDENGQKQYSPEYLSMSPKERAKNSYVVWDVETRCVDFEAINAWVEEHKFG